VASDVEICNRALNHLGVGKEISNLTTETGDEALACRQNFAPLRDMMFRDFPYSFATKIVTLGLVEENPTTEWNYSYSYPSDCLFVRRIPSGLRNDNRQSQVSYRVMRSDAGLLIYTDMKDAELEYTFRATDGLQYPEDFAWALSWLMATVMAPRLTAGDPFKLGDRAVQFYEAFLGKAQANDLNEQQPDEEPQSEMIRERNGDQNQGSRQSFNDFVGI